MKFFNVSNNSLNFSFQISNKVQLYAQLSNTNRPESIILTKSKKLRYKKNQASPKHSMRRKTVSITHHKSARQTKLSAISLISPFSCFQLYENNNNYQHKNKVSTETQTETLFANCNIRAEDTNSRCVMKTDYEDYLNGNSTSTTNKVL